MTRAWQDIRVTPGSISDERLPGTLAPRRFMLRPKSLAEAFYAAGQRLGAEDVPLARASRHAGPWARLFQNEPAFLYTEILSFHAEDEGFVFAEALEAEPQRALRLLIALARRLDAWITRIRLDASGPFSKQLDQLDKEANLSGLLAQITKSGPAALIRIAEDHASVRTVAQSGNMLAKARATRERLRSLHALLRNAVTSLQNNAQSAFDARLVSQNMDPGLGLLIAELKTSAHVDAAINDIVDRHTRLYYTDIIGQTPALPGAETVLLDLGSVPRSGFLPQGSTLDARLTDGTVQRFETRSGVPISPARVSDVRLMRFDTNPNISYNRALGGITGVRAARFDPSGNTSPSDGTLFDAGVDVPAHMGLDIASPMLSLAEGTRRIEVSLHMTRGSNLPTQARALTPEERHERSMRRRAAARPKTPPDLRRAMATMPEHADPEVRLALQADPALSSAFSSDKSEIAVEDLTIEITSFADRTDRTTSMGVIYEYLMDHVQSAAQLRLLLGRIVTISLIEQHPFPANDYWDRIFALVERYREDLIGKTPLDPDNTDHAQNSMIFAAFSQRPDGTIDYPPEDVFQSLLGDAFDITITTDAGPRAPDIMQVMPVREKRADGGITLSLRYDSSAPGLTGPDHAPCLALRYATDARLCPLSFFEAYGIETITIRCQVTGLKRLAAFSEDGPLAIDQTFQPFGPRPEDGATFMVGCAEMARKPVTQVSISMEWARTPNPVGGFESHYQHYGRNLEVPSPELAIDYLSGDGWKPVSTHAVPLFQSEGVTGAILPSWQFSGQVSGHSVPAQGKVTQQEYQSRQTIRAGMVRMRVSGTAGGFLADRYPMALVEAMRPRLIPRGPRKVPPAPYIPEISHFALSYTAEATIELNAPDTARPGEVVRQISPFGHVSLFPDRQVKQARLFPKRLGYGQVAFQLSGPNITGPTAMVISVAASGHLRRVPQANPVTWMYLTQNGWQPLEETALSADTTAGLMRSGIVVFDLPEDAAQDASFMPGGGVWIAAVATSPNLGVFPALTGARINGVWAQRCDDTFHPTGAKRDWSFNPAQPGLTNLTEIPTPNFTRPAELQDTFVARVGERLRHRRRGITPWDMERMVLEEFPEIWMVKCLPHLSQDSTEPAPGQVTLVVVRNLPETEVMHTPKPLFFDVATLQGIRTWLSKYCSEEARIDVVNPTFERLQVRAKIAVHSNLENSVVAQLLRRDLARKLSVWTAEPALKRFGWSLNVHMLRAAIEGLDEVQDVTDFSVLHLVGDDSRRYQLLDTAQTRSDPRGIYGPVLRPRFPWSLPLTTPQHKLVIVPDLKQETPTAAGIGALTLGDMLIVGQRTPL